MSYFSILGLTTIAPAVKLTESYSTPENSAKNSQNIKQIMIIGSRTQTFESPDLFRDQWDSEVYKSGLAFNTLFSLKEKGAFSMDERSLLSPTRLKIVRTWTNMEDFQTWYHSSERAALESFLKSHGEFFSDSEHIQFS